MERDFMRKARPTRAGFRLGLVMLAALSLAACGGLPEGGRPVPSEPTPKSNQLTYSAAAEQAYGVFESQGRAVGSKLYSFGGFDVTRLPNYGPTNRAYVYDAVANTWQAIRSMPGCGVSHGGSATDGRYVYLAGGYPAATLSCEGQVFGTRSVWRYDPARNDYDQLPDLPEARGGGQLEFLNGKLHYFGGSNLARNDVTTHYVLDVQGGATSWQSAAPLPQATNHFGSAVLNGRIYAIGGQTGQDGASTTLDVVQVYDPGSNTWTFAKPMLRGRSHISASTFVLNGRIIVAGGETSYTATVADVTAYDPVTNSWTAMTPLVSPRMAGLADAIGPTSFVFTGGSESKTTWRATVK